MQIWKTKISLGKGSEVTLLPKGAKPISVHVQDGTPCMWWVVDPDAEIAPKQFHIAGTGHELPDNLGDFIGTFLVQDGAYGFHVFEIDE